MRLTGLLLIVALFAVPALAGEPTPVVVERTRFVLEVAADGRVAPGAVVESRLTPLNFRGRYTLLTAVEPGQVVREGDVVMTFDDREIVKALEEGRFALSVAEREFAAQMARLKQKSLAAELELTGKRREMEAAADALKNYLEHTLPLQIERAERDALSAERSVQNARDELDQLEKMYAEDELVDETEDIVLKRARWDLENRLVYQEQRKRQREFEQRFTWKEQREGLEFTLRQRQFNMQRAELEDRLARDAWAIEAERALRAIEDRRKGVAELAADVSDFTFRAPRDGIVLHGEKDGALDRFYRRGTQFGPESVAFVIVDPEQLVAEFGVPAEDVLRIEPGQQVRLKPAVVGQTETPAVVVERSILPRGGKLALTARPEKPFEPGLLGSALKATVVLSELDDVLVIPLSAVQREGTKALCRRPLEGGGTRLVPVILGPDDGKLVVVLEGLEEGDEVLAGEVAE